MEGEQEARSAFRASIAAAQSSLVRSFEDEITRRDAASAQEISQLRHENALLKHQLSVTDSLRALLQCAEEKCSALEDELRQMTRQLDLQKRQSSEFSKANVQLKCRVRRAESRLAELGSGPSGAMSPAKPSDANAGIVHRSMPSIASGLASPRASHSKFDQRPNTAPLVPAHAADEAVTHLGTEVNDGQEEVFERRLRSPSHSDEAMSRPVQVPSQTGVIQCSQSTEDGASLEEATPIKIETHADSSPVQVTNVRTVRRPAHHTRAGPSGAPDAWSKARHDGSERKPFLIKEETGSSPPGHFGRPEMHEPLDSLDLDEISEFVRTPHKRQRLERQLSRRLPEGLSLKQASVLGFERAMSMPSSVPPMDDHRHRHADLPLFTANVRPAAQAEPARTSVKSIKAKDEPRTPSRTARVLFPVSNNEQNKRRPRIEALASKEERRPRNEAVEDVTEDGEDLPASGEVLSDGVEDGSQENGPDRAQLGSRLAGLLDAPASQTTTSLPRIKPEPATQKRKRKPEHDADSTPTTKASASARGPKRPNIGQYFETTSKTSPRRKTKTRPAQQPTTPPSPRPGRTAHDPPRLSPADEPLRSRPLATLGLADFKVNADVNDGQCFAYAETLRTKHAKQCQPGCMDPRCCGSLFRKLAQMGAPLPPASRPRRSLMQATPSQDEEPLPPGVSSSTDLALLEAHLGGPGAATRARIARMSAAQRAAELLEARAALLASAHGKHRARFERAAEPDAFWDVDFPSSQQVRASKEAARMGERQRVEARYREALKGRAGRGRFLFRDE